MQKYALASSWVIAPNWPPMKWETAQGKLEQTLQIFPCHHLRPHTLPGLSSVFGKVSQIISGQQAPLSDCEWAKPDFFEKGWDLCLWNGRQLEKSEPMSWRGNRPVPTGVQAGREIGARSGWGAYCRGAWGIRNTTQSLEVAQGEEKGASKVDECCQNEIELETSVQGGIFFRIFIKFMHLGQTGSRVSPDNLMFKSLIIFCICTRPKYKYGQWTVSTGHCSGP